MKELEDLTELERLVLLACCDANRFSLSSHVQLEKITKRIVGVESKYIKKAIKLLLSNGFIRLDPVGRSRKTYQINKKGLVAATQIRDEITANQESTSTNT